MLIIQIIGWAIVIFAVVFLSVLAVGPFMADWKEGKW